MIVVAAVSVESRNRAAHSVNSKVANSNATTITFGLGGIGLPNKKIEDEFSSVRYSQPIEYSKQVVLDCMLAEFQ